MKLGWRLALAMLVFVGGTFATGLCVLFGAYLLLCEDVSDCTEQPATGIALLVLAAVLLPTSYLTAARIAGGPNWIAAGLLVLAATVAAGAATALTPLRSWTIPVGLLAGALVLVISSRSDAPTRTPR